MADDDGELPLLEQGLNGELQRNVGAGDGCGAGAPVGLDHITVEIDLPAAQLLKVDHGAQRAADETLDLLRAAVGAVAGPTDPLRRGARQQAAQGTGARGRGARAGSRHGRDSDESSSDFHQFPIHTRRRSTSP